MFNRKFNLVIVFLCLVFSISSVKAMDIDTLKKELVANLWTYKDKVEVNSDSNSLSVIFTEELEKSDPLEVNVTFKLNGDILEYEFNKTSDNDIYYIKEGLIRNLIIENVIKAVGSINGYSKDDIDTFLSNITKLNPMLKTHGIVIDASPFEYKALADDGNSDIAINVYLENINNYGKGNDNYTKVLDFPIEGYEYNESKTKCLNDSEIELIEVDEKIAVNINAGSQDICNVYFGESNFFNYDLTINSGLIKKMSINLKEFDPTNLQVNDNIEENNPNTGMFLPISVLLIFIICSGVIFYIIKRKQKIYKI